MKVSLVLGLKVIAYKHYYTHSTSFLISSVAAIRKLHSQSKLRYTAQPSATLAGLWYRRVEFSLP